MSDALTNRVRQLAEMAYAEDVGRGDLTSSLTGDPPEKGTQLFSRGHHKKGDAALFSEPNPENPAESDEKKGGKKGVAQEKRATSPFLLAARQAGVFAGREVVPTVLEVFGGEIDVAWTDAGCDGARMSNPPVTLAELRGPVQRVLTVERTLLNFLQRLCGIATYTRAFVDAVAGTGAEILDTRKTTPGWRVLEKYAVRCGGGRNHRMGLFDAVLIKDNHLAGCPPERTAAAVHEMLNRLAGVDPPPKFIEVEADSLAQVEQLFDVVGVDVILLDNFSLADMRRAVELRDARNLRGKVKLEASGGITLEAVRAIAETGVDCVSVGALTHSAIALDLAVDRID